MREKFPTSRVAIPSVILGAFAIGCATAPSRTDRQLADASPLLSQYLTCVMKKAGPLNFAKIQARWDARTAFAMGEYAYLAYEDSPQSDGRALGFAKVVTIHHDTHTTWLDALGRINHFQLPVFSADTDAVWLENDEMIVLAFRGTDLAKPNKLIDVWTDLDVAHTPMMNEAIQPAQPSLGGVHQGFYTSMMQVWPQISDMLAHVKRLPSGKRKPLFVTGHSLGGAVATLFTVKELQLLQARQSATDNDDQETSDRSDSTHNFWVQGLYTFGSPWVGDAKFKAVMDQVINDQRSAVEFDPATQDYDRPRGMAVARFVNASDPVAFVPPLTHAAYDRQKDYTLYFAPKFDDAATDAIPIDGHLRPEAIPDTLFALPDFGPTKATVLMNNHLFKMYFRHLGKIAGHRGFRGLPAPSS